MQRQEIASLKSKLELRDQHLSSACRFHGNDQLDAINDIKVTSDETVEKAETNKNPLEDASNSTIPRKKSCSVPGCRKENVSVFQFPKDQPTAIKWIAFLTSCGKKVHPNVQYLICERHFKANEIKTNKKLKTLNAGTVPSIADVPIAQESNVKLTTSVEHIPKTLESSPSTKVLTERILSLQHELKKEREKTKQLNQKLLKVQTSQLKMKKYIAKKRITAKRRSENVHSSS